jgi:hypothetical protein
MSLTLKQFAALGGKARAAKLSKERRIKIASDAGKASALQRASKKQKPCQSDETHENKV